MLLNLYRQLPFYYDNVNILIDYLLTNIILHIVLPNSDALGCQKRFSWDGKDVNIL